MTNSIGKFSIEEDSPRGIRKRKICASIGGIRWLTQWAWNLLFLFILLYLLYEIYLINQESNRDGSQKTSLVRELAEMKKRSESSIAEIGENFTLEEAEMEESVTGTKINLPDIGTIVAVNESNGDEKAALKELWAEGRTGTGRLVLRKMDTLEQLIARRLDEMEQSTAEKIVALENSTNTRLAAIKRENDEKFAAMNSSHIKVMGALEELSVIREMATKQDTDVGEKSELEERVEKILAEMEEKLMIKEAQTKESLAEQIANFKRLTTSRVSELEKSNAQSVIAFENSTITRLAAIRASDTEQLNAVNHSLFAEIEAMKESSANELVSIGEMASTRIDTISSRLEQFITEKRGQDYPRKEARNELIPIGFVYTQLPFQAEPSQLWNWAAWEQVTKKYAGHFFRAEGGNSLAFGINQTDAFQGHAHNPTGHQASSWDGSGNKYIDLIYSTSSHRSISDGLHGEPRVAKETRPVNFAVRIWKRVM